MAAAVQAKLHIAPFETMNVAATVIKPPRANAGGKGKTVYVDRPAGEDSRFRSPKDMRLMWAIRPGMDATVINAYDRFNLEVEVAPEHAAFLATCEAFDDFILATALKGKKDFLAASKEKYVTDINSLKPLYNGLIKAGSASKDGSRTYNPSLRLKVDGWAPYVGSLVREEREIGGQKTSVVRSCEWKNRVVDAAGHNTPTERDTRFLMFAHTNPVTGADVFRETVDVLDAAGAPVLDAAGAPLTRWVGPGDANPNDRVTVVFAISKLYVMDGGFGPMVTAKEVLIKPTVSERVRATVDGVEVVRSSVLATVLAARAAAAAAAEGTVETADTTAEEAETTVEQAETTVEDAVADAGEEVVVGKKKKRAATPLDGQGKKKKRAVDLVVEGNEAKRATADDGEYEENF